LLSKNKEIAVGISFLGGILLKIKTIIFVLCICGLCACGKTQEREKAFIDSNIDDSTIGKVNEEKTEDNDLFTYGKLKCINFWFGSGAGAWCTQMKVDSAGHFLGEYHDSNMGIYDDDYPNGEQYYCKFEGDFGPLEKVDDFTYKTSISHISYANTPDTQEIKDGILYYYTEPYGLEDATDIYFYLPGAQTSSISEDVLSWTRWQWGLWDDMKSSSFDSEVVPGVILANTNMGYGFQGYDFVLYTINGMDDYENLEESMPDKYSDEVLRIWDNYLNEIWECLIATVPNDDMEEIRADERRWILDRDSEGNSSDNPNKTKIEMTKARINYLLEVVDKYYSVIPQ